MGFVDGEGVTTIRDELIEVKRDAEPLGRDIIHSVTNPIPRLTGAIHIYGGDFFAAARSEWDSETLEEQRWDAERAVRRFEEANRTMVSS